MKFKEKPNKEFKKEIQSLENKNLLFVLIGIVKHRTGSKYDSADYKDCDSKEIDYQYRIIFNELLRRLDENT